MWKWKFLCWLIRTLSWGDQQRTRRFTRLHSLVQKELEGGSDRWLTHKVRLKDPPAPLDNSGPSTPIALVMQGKLLKDQSFTLKTIRHYRQTLPGSLLIVSTWRDEDPALLQELEQAGARIILSEPPEFPGPSNVNYQIRSTLAGIEAARAAGYEYVLKTRADVRMYATGISDYLVALHRQFPVARGLGQRGRLLALDLATRTYIPQHPSDILMFGLTDDLFAYWNTPFCENPREAVRPVGKRFGDIINSVIPEVYLCRQHLTRIGYSHEPTIANWWRCLADLFLVVDRVSLEHFWFKYDYNVEHQSQPDDQRRNAALCTFRDWLAISTFDKQPSITLEQLLPQPFNAPVRNAA